MVFIDRAGAYDVWRDNAAPGFTITRAAAGYIDYKLDEDGNLIEHYISGSWKCPRPTLPDMVEIYRVVYAYGERDE